MFVHRILRGPNAGLYLPFGQSRLRALRRQRGDSSFFQEKHVVGGYTIEVQQAPPYAAIRIVQVGGFYFEFFTSGKPVVTSAGVQEALTYTTYDAAVVGCDVSTKGNLVSAAPQILLGKRFVNTGDASVVGRPQQVQLVNEPVVGVSPALSKANKGRPYQRLLYESYAPMHSHTGIPLRSFNTYQQGWGADSASLRDIGFDVPWADTIGKKKPYREAYLRDAADWPRASGICTVVDPTYGSREFAIYVDAFSQFSVFPTGQIGPVSGITQNVPNADVVTVKPTLPGWVYQMTGKYSAWSSVTDPQGVVSFPEIDWKIHPDGTKACAVVYARNAVTYDAGYFAGLPSPGGSPSTDFTDVVLPNTGYTTLAGVQPQRYNCATGLLELALNITLTGFAPENFSFNVVVNTLRDPTLTPYCSLICGYTWYDVLNRAGGKYATRGDLCVLDVENYYNLAGALSVNQYPATALASTSLMSLKNLTTNAEIKTFGGGLADYDMSTLSFAIKISSVTVIHDVVNRRAVPAYPLSFAYDFHITSTLNADFDILHPAVAIFTFNTLRETLYPSNIQTDQIPILAAQATNMDTGGLRTAVAGKTMFALNDAGTWTTYSRVRNAIAYQDGYTSDATIGATVLTTAELNYFALNTLGAGSGNLIFITNPQFGWYAYASAIALSLMKNASTTLFAHPNGSWAYFDATTIYNQNGSRFPLAYYDTLTRFVPSKVSQVIYDRVHLEIPQTKSLDTTFLALYNQALTGSIGPNVLTDTFVPFAYSDFQATFTADTYTDSTDPHGRVFVWSELIATWPNGTVAYLPDEWQQRGDTIVPTWGSASNPFQLSTFYTGNGYFNFSTDVAFYGATAYGGTFLPPSPTNMFAPTFSSPILITG